MASAAETRRLKVVVVGFWFAGVSRSDGFVQRNARVIDALRDHFDVTAIALASPGAEPAPDYDLRIEEPRDSEVTSRGDRVHKAIKVALGRLGWNWAERRVRRHVRAAHPDVIVALLRRRPELVGLVADLAPTAYFSEEHVGHWHKATPSKVPPVMSWLLRTGRRRAARRAAVAVVLDEREAGISARVLGLDVAVVPHAFDLDYWTTPVAPDPDAGPFDVLVVANCTTPRNALNLAQVIDCLEVEGWPLNLRLRIVSAAGYLPALVDRASPRVDLLGEVDDLRPLYAAAACVLVPDFSAKGVKNGVIQAWATRTPVVAARPSAETVGGVDGVDLLAGDDPEELARLLAHFGGRAGSALLADAGHHHLFERFSTEAHDAAVVALVRRLAGDSSESGAPDEVG